VGPAGAAGEDVVHEHLGLEMAGRLEIAPGKSLEQDGAALILHGTLAHHGMEIIRDLQANLKERGINTLAMTLTLGLNRRTGMFDCALEHDHRHGDAVEELAAWTEWLISRGARSVHVIGHSRGGAQAALFAVEEPTRISGRLVLVAPSPEPTAGEAEAGYRARFGAELAPLLNQARQREEGGEADALMTVPGFLYCQNARVTAAAFIDYYGSSRPSLTSLLQGLAVPTLVIAAGADEIVRDLPETLRRETLPNNVQVDTIDGADHFFRDLFGEELADKVAAFLNAK
jgi:pimeloyl-ACP methyl ester carboxylesterase